MGRRGPDEDLKETSLKDRDVARDPWRGVHDAIRHLIITGEYPPGSRLVEQQLADRFGTSRGPVRTALQELERSGLVVSIDRRGTFVRSVSDTDIEEILSLGELISQFALRRAAARIGPAEREWLEAFRARPVPSDVTGFLEHITEFGRELFKMAQHSRALKIYETMLVQAQARTLFLIGAEMSEQALLERFDYGPLCHALARGDADAAIEASDAVIGVIRQYWLGRLHGAGNGVAAEVPESRAAG
jgi:DNA-binding GntR family transcriptional regulator